MVFMRSPHAGHLRTKLRDSCRNVPDLNRTTAGLRKRAYFEQSVYRTVLIDSFVAAESVWFTLGTPIDKCECFMLKVNSTSTT